MMKHKMIKKDVVLIIILLLTIVCVVYAIKWYKVYKEFNYSNAIISSYLPELTYEEYETYMQEVSSGFIYFCVSSNIECRNFEKNFKKVVSKYGLNSQIVYLDVENISKYDYFDKHSNINVEIDIPSIVYFENHKIIDYIEKNMSEKEIIKFINKYE